MEIGVLNRISKFVLAATFAVGVGIIATNLLSAQEGSPIPAASEEHKVLLRYVGTWDAEMKLFISPDAEPMVSRCSEKNELLPGGLWVITRFEGSIAGAPFSGVGTIGYDPVEKKHVGTWVDSMTPHILLTKGDYDVESRTLTGFGNGRNPETGEMVAYKQITRHIDDDTRSFEMLMPLGGGEYEKMMEIRYTRRAE